MNPAAAESRAVPQRGARDRAGAHARAAVADRDDAARVLPLRPRDASRRDARPRAAASAQRLEALGQGSNPLMAVVGVAESVVGQAARVRQDAVRPPARLRRRGEGAQERQGRLRHRGAGDRHLHRDRAPGPRGRRRRDRQLAASIRADEQKMLERVLREIPKLTDAVVRADVKGEPLLRPHHDRRRRRRPRGRPRRPRRPRARRARRRPSGPRARPARSRASPRPRARSRAPSRPRATSRSRATTRSPPTRSSAG